MGLKSEVLCFPFLNLGFMLVTQMESHVDPGPIDKSLLYDQDNHISSAIWDGQVRQVLLCH